VVIRKIIALTLLAACLSACSSITPITPGTVTQQPRTEAEAGQALAVGSNTGTSQKAAPTTEGDLKITILYDNTLFDPRPKADEGFATLIEYKGHTLMFDTGARGSILLHNMQKLGVDPRSIEAIVLSHEHSDHTGGLQALLNNGNRPTVYVPSAFSSGFKKSVSDKTKLVEVTDAFAVLPSIYTT
jgi:glyoxylase-like metal-dependent hydrolase (beta-lactamase superfamily II)